MGREGGGADAWTGPSRQNIIIILTHYFYYYDDDDSALRFIAGSQMISRPGAQSGAWTGGGD